MFPITLFVFSNSSHLEPRLVCLVPCECIPQSVQTPAIRTLINFQSRDPSTPVNLRFLYRHPFGFWFFESTLSLWLSAHLIPGSWLQLCSCLWFLSVPFVPCYIGFTDLDLDSVFDHSFVCRFCTLNLWLPGYDLCLNKQRFLHSPWSASGSSPEHHKLDNRRLEKFHLVWQISNSVATCRWQVRIFAQTAWILG